VTRPGALDVLGRIRGFGVKTSIDDFGTEYSSMSYLRLLPVDELKIDRSFVGDMAPDVLAAWIASQTRAGNSHLDGDDTHRRPAAVS
jgi:EAL domain-containing protein (putative c-di-GMP-specific phosphodiesterase class I)